MLVCTRGQLSLEVCALYTTYGANHQHTFRIILAVAERTNATKGNCIVSRYNVLSHDPGSAPTALSGLCAIGTYIYSVAHWNGAQADERRESDTTFRCVDLRLLGSHFPMRSERSVTCTQQCPTARLPLRFFEPMPFAKTVTMCRTQ